MGGNKQWERVQRVRHCIHTFSGSFSFMQWVSAFTKTLPQLTISQLKEKELGKTLKDKSSKTFIR